jgi:hypothetical protein
MPNVLQNLLGEGTLSASFIPVYSELLERAGRRKRGGWPAPSSRCSSPWPGAGPGRDLRRAGAGLGLHPRLRGRPALRPHGGLIRIIFPMAGILVLSAWSLGVLNSHRRFFISYVAPVVWNASMIGALIVFGGRRDQASLAVILAWAALLGGALQFAGAAPVRAGGDEVAGSAGTSSWRACERRSEERRPRHRGAWRGPAERVRGHLPGLDAGGGRGGHADLRAAALHPPGEPVRDVRGGGGAAGALPAAQRRAEVLRAGGGGAGAGGVLRDPHDPGVHRGGRRDRGGAVRARRVHPRGHHGHLAHPGRPTAWGCWRPRGPGSSPPRSSRSTTPDAGQGGGAPGGALGRAGRAPHDAVRRVSFAAPSWGPCDPRVLRGSVRLRGLGRRPVGGRSRWGPSGWPGGGRSLAWLEWWLLQRSLSQRIGSVRPPLGRWGGWRVAALPAAAVGRGWRGSSRR